MKKLLSFLIIALSATSLFAQTTWKIMPANSKLAFVTTHLGIADIAGLFKTFDVTLTNNQPDFSDAVFELSADISSINTEVEMRDNHLRSADFFDAATYPKMTFKSTSIKKIGNDKYKLTGNLTMHGITKNITMNLWYRGTTYDQITKSDLAGFQLTGSINRLDFGIGPKFPSAMISDKVSIKADGEFQKK